MEAPQDLSIHNALRLTFSVSGDPVRLSPEMQDEVIQIAREAIANARRHSQGTRTEVKLEYAKNFSLSISDDGRGVDPIDCAHVANGHFGLRGMRERAANIGGKLTISSEADHGAQVKLVLPKRVFLRIFRRRAG